MARAGRPFRVAWREDDTEQALQAAYRGEGEPMIRQRLHALWLLRPGERQVGDVAAVLGVNYRTVQQWVAWYRDGGLEEVRGHRRGGPGRSAWLSPEQQEAVATEVATGRFHTAMGVQRWIVERYGVSYTQAGMYTLLERLRCAPKVPRPLHTNANLEEQEAWKKGGLQQP